MLTGMRRHALLAAPTVLLLLLSGCGGDDGDSNERGITDVAGDDSGDTSDEGAADEASGDDVEAAEDQLAAFTSDECGELFAGLGGASSAVGGDGGPDGKDLTDVAEYFNRIADEVPSEIEADFRIFAEAYEQFAEAAAEAGVDFSKPETMTPEALAEMGDAAETFNDIEVQEASERVSQFVEEVCGTSAGG